MTEPVSPDVVLANLGGRIETFGERAERGRKYGRLRVLTAADAALAPPRSYLLKGLIAAGEIVLIYGQPKSGKSFLALRLAYGLAVVQGFGSHDAVRPARCLYVAAEGEGGFAGRVVALRDTLGDDGDRFHYIAQRVCVGPPSSDLESLIAAAVSLKVDLVVLDTVARTFGDGDENATKDMSAFITALDQLREAVQAQSGTFPAIVCIHHRPKSGDSARGSVALPAAADCIIRVERLGEDGNIARVEAAKDDADGAVIGFRLVPVEIGGDDDGEVRRTCIAEARPVPLGAMSGRVPPQTQTALTALIDTINTKGSAIPISPGFPPSPTQGCREEDWRSECDRCRLSDSKSREGQDRIFRRVRSDLIQAQLIDTHAGWVWRRRGNEREVR